MTEFYNRFITRYHIHQYVVLNPAQVAGVFFMVLRNGIAGKVVNVFKNGIMRNRVNKKYILVLLFNSEAYDYKQFTRSCSILGAVLHTIL
jgi:hypothetical protein